jgi:dolichol-phosphate mannosyltransferase
LLSLTLVLLAGQAAALVVVVLRLLPGRRRAAPVRPRAHGDPSLSVDDTVSVVIPARNEVSRIGRCLGALQGEGAQLLEVIVVDGRSTDGTRELVARAGESDPRVRLIDEPDREDGAVGRPWAIAAGCRQARGRWILVLDADAAPRPGIVPAVVGAAREHRLDSVSFAPAIVAPTTGALVLQQSFLTTLVYRLGAVGVRPSRPELAMANGQCQLFRREVLELHGGYRPAVRSYCDDVRIARHLSSRGAAVGFLDGHRLLDVEMYRDAAETWRAWPPSLNLRDATTVPRRIVDAAVLLLAQWLPLPAMAWLVASIAAGSTELVPVAIALLVINSALILLRIAILAATAHSFTRRNAAYWLAPLADLVAVPRVVLTMARPVREWRGGGHDTRGDRVMRSLRGDTP